MCKHHVEGALKMVELKGGPHSLGLNGFLKHLLSKITIDRMHEALPCCDGVRLFVGQTIGVH